MGEQRQPLAPRGGCLAASTPLQPSRLSLPSAASEAWGPASPLPPALSRRSWQGPQSKGVKLTLRDVSSMRSKGLRSPCFPLAPAWEPCWGSPPRCCQRPWLDLVVGAVRAYSQKRKWQPLAPHRLSLSIPRPASRASRAAWPALGPPLLAPLLQMLWPCRLKRGRKGNLAMRMWTPPLDLCMKVV